MKKFFVLILSCFPYFTYSQSYAEAEKALKNIDRIEQFEQLMRDYPDWKISLDKTLVSDSIKFPQITGGKIGDIVKKQHHSKAPKFALKILKEVDEELCKVKYIYLDGSKLSSAKIDSIRSIILERYKNGEEFETLVKEYTMDGNSTGDLGWFYKGMMVDDFDAAVRTRKQGEIFTVDVPQNNWYYVVLKTHSNKTEPVKLGIKIKYF
ncbi:MAG: peptidylprolyl isomerase [Flavobacteriales bacterium]|nr:peptidylprolyl isomerase [Flavobacteriales bacterium]